MGKYSRLHTVCLSKVGHSKSIENGGSLETVKYSTSRAAQSCNKDVNYAMIWQGDTGTGEDKLSPNVICKGNIKYKHRLANVQISYKDIQRNPKNICPLGSWNIAMILGNKSRMS